MASEEELRAGIKKLLAAHNSAAADPKAGTKFQKDGPTRPSKGAPSHAGTKRPRSHVDHVDRRQASLAVSKTPAVHQSVAPSKSTHHKALEAKPTTAAKEKPYNKGDSASKKGASEEKPRYRESSAPRHGGASSHKAPTVDFKKVEASISRLTAAIDSLSGKCNAAGQNWFESNPAKFGLPTPGAAAGTTALPVGLQQRFRDLADRCYAAELSAFERRVATATSAESKWRRTALTSGTASDKLAAMTLLVQDSPVHALRHLDGLLAIAKKRGRRESQQAIEALKDLFLTNLLPADRKLVPFDARNIADACDGLKAEHLVFWYFEDELKVRYAQLIATLQDHLSDAISYFKSNALKTVADLLTERSEQEAALLSILVNKLGDPEGKVASKAQFLMAQLVQKHEAMKPVVVREIRQFLIRPHLSQQALYFAVIFLNQLTLSKKFPAMAGDLIDAYLGLFELVIKRNQLDTKLLAAVLTGVNRAFPFADEAAVRKDIEQRIDVLFDVVHKATFGASVQALMLLQQITSKAGASTEEDTKLKDRFYRALYAKITAEELDAAAKHTLFLNLIYKSCKYDDSPARIRCILKRLLQVAFYLPATFAAGSVMLVSEVIRSRPELLSLLVKSSDGKQHDDASDEASTSGVSESEGEIVLPTEAERSAALSILDSIDVNKTPAGDAPVAREATHYKYDPWKRDPKYSGGDDSCLWELLSLSLHYHPSVRKFIDALLERPLAPINYQGDPLVDFTLMAFLDRYVYKNPKAKTVASATGAGKPLGIDISDEQAMGYAIVQGHDPETLRAMASGLLHGSSAMQPKRPRHGRADIDEPATSKAFVEQDLSAVRPEDVFMHTFFRAKTAGEEQRRKSDLDMDALEADDEEAVDKFADKLADDLLRAVGGGDADVDEEFDEGWSQISDEEQADADFGHDDDASDDGSVPSGSDDDGEEFDNKGQFASDSEDDEDDFDVASLIDDEASDADEVPPQVVVTSSKPKRAKTVVYADADEYADMLDDDNEPPKVDKLEPRAKSVPFGKKPKKGKRT